MSLHARVCLRVCACVCAGGPFLVALWGKESLSTCGAVGGLWRPVGVEPRRLPGEQGGRRECEGCVGVLWRLSFAFHQRTRCSLQKSCPG